MDICFCNKKKQMSFLNYLNCLTSAHALSLSFCHENSCPCNTKICKFIHPQGSHLIGLIQKGFVANKFLFITIYPVSCSNDIKTYKYKGTHLQSKKMVMSGHPVKVTVTFLQSFMIVPSSSGSLHPVHMNEPAVHIHTQRSPTTTNLHRTHL